MPPRKRRSRGYIEQLPSGSWRAVVYAGTDPLTSKPRYVRETAKSYDAAEKALTKLQRQVDEDQHPKTAITVRQAVTQSVRAAAPTRPHRQTPTKTSDRVWPRHCMALSSASRCREPSPASGSRRYWPSPSARPP